jgi:hypothetical protein
MALVYLSSPWENILALQQYIKILVFQITNKTKLTGVNIKILVFQITNKAKLTVVNFINILRAHFFNKSAFL